MHSTHTHWVGREMMRRTLARVGAAIGLAAAAAMLAFGSAATAAPGGSVDLGQPYSWSGGPGQGLYAHVLLDVVGIGAGSKDVACTPIYECDSTLLHVLESGDLKIALDGDPGDTPYTAGQLDADLDLYLFASDAQGTVGEEIDRSTRYSPDEEMNVPGVEPGYYLARVQYYIAVNASFTADATLTEPVAELR